MSHRHKAIRETGPWCCAGGVAYVDTCACGAKRRTCSCHQCRMESRDDSGWYMPLCPDCGYHHADDVACPVTVAP